MAHRRFLRLAGVAVLTILLPGSTLVAAAAAAPAIEPRAAEILKAALTHLAGAASVTVRAEMVEETTLPTGEKLQYPGTLELSLRRPDRLRYTIDGEQRRVAAWYDGKGFTLLDSDKNVCATTPAPQTLAALFDQMEKTLGFRPPLSILMREDSIDVAMARLTSGFYAGRGAVGGVPSHHLAFRQESIDWQIWVAAEGAPAIRRIVVTRKKAPGAPQLAFTSFTWDFNAALSDALFQFEPPPGVVRCEFQLLTK
jgi:hypothetical protein